MSGFDLSRSPWLASLGLVAADVHAAAAGFELWQNEVLGNLGMTISSRTRDRMSLADVFEGLLPLTTPIRTRYAFLGTKSKWSVFFDNGRLGTDAASTMNVLAGRLKCEALRVSCVEPATAKEPGKFPRGRYGAMILEVYAPDQSTRRTIYSANDGGRWVFGQSGEPFTFEDQDAYGQKIIRNRFTGAMLTDYLSHLEARPFEKSWYTGEVVSLKKEGALPATLVEYSEHMR